MWKLKIAEGGGSPWLRTVNGHVGRQFWEFDPTEVPLGSTDHEIITEIDKARENFHNNRFHRKHSSDLLMRIQWVLSPALSTSLPRSYKSHTLSVQNYQLKLQQRPFHSLGSKSFMIIQPQHATLFSKENPSRVVLPQVKVNDTEDITEDQVTTTLRRAISFHSTLQAHDGHWPGDYGGPMFLMPGLVITLSIVGALNAVLSKAHKYEMCRYIYNHQARPSVQRSRVFIEQEFYLLLTADNCCGTSKLEQRELEVILTMILQGLQSAIWVLDDCPGNLDFWYRHISKGAWPFSTADHGWPISDCTAEGLKGLLCSFLLPLQNSDGGFATYELTRSYRWLEVVSIYCLCFYELLLNPAETFGDIVIDYPYVECTSAAMQALSSFKKLYPGHRHQEIEGCIERAAMFIEKIQAPDGSWYGSWAVCFTYGAWFGIKGLVAAGKNYHNCSGIRKACDFLLSRQRASGGWGESYLSCQNKVSPITCKFAGSGLFSSISIHEFDESVDFVTPWSWFLQLCFDLSWTLSYFFALGQCFYLVPGLACNQQRGFTSIRLQ
ncbi:hypothetical protein RHSIM_Rhsim03G0270500 [Rhododendron simsii]|uniref:cycloartenol synthase n=1 Tax=Rhododendron simsii TaxID=118357 RepID=A0A834LSN6_RHOSS|nr:hypothetical protein RHSIM_Rhsim03G0270500 [Rhododendron simsii]